MPEYSGIRPCVYIVSPEGESFSEWLRAVAGTNEMGSVYPRRLGSLPLVPLAAGAQSLGRPGLARTGSVRGGLVTRALPGEGLLFLARSKSRQESSRKARPRPGAGFPEGALRSAAGAGRCAAPLSILPSVK